MMLEPDKTVVIVSMIKFDVGKKQPSPQRQTNISLFEATQLFRQTNNSLDFLSKHMSILRRRKDKYGRNNNLREDKLKKILCLKFHTNSKVSCSNDRTPEKPSLIKKTSLHFDRIKDTRETSRCLKKTLQEIRHSEADQLREIQTTNRKRLQQMRMLQAESKRQKRNRIVQLERLQKQNSCEYINKKILKTSQHKRRNILEFMSKRQAKEQIILSLEKQKENLMRQFHEKQTLSQSLRLTLNKVTQSRPSALMALFRKQHLNRFQDFS